MIRLNERLSDTLRMKVSNGNLLDSVLSFTVENELEAYKAAYYYRYSKNVTVEFAPNVNQWLVVVRHAG